MNGCSATRIALPPLGQLQCILDYIHLRKALHVYDLLGAISLLVVIEALEFNANNMVNMLIE